jgi:hypothetical protein
MDGETGLTSEPEGFPRGAFWVILPGTARQHRVGGVR